MATTFSQALLHTLRDTTASFLDATRNITYNLGDLDKQVRAIALNPTAQKVTEVALNIGSHILDTEHCEISAAGRATCTFAMTSPNSSEHYDIDGGISSRNSDETRPILDIASGYSPTFSRSIRPYNGSTADVSKHGSWGVGYCYDNSNNIEYGSRCETDQGSNSFDLGKLSYAYIFVVEYRCDFAQPIEQWGCVAWGEAFGSAHLAYQAVGSDTSAAQIGFGLYCDSLCIHQTLIAAAMDGGFEDAVNSALQFGKAHLETLHPAAQIEEVVDANCAIAPAPYQTRPSYIYAQNTAPQQHEYDEYFRQEFGTSYQRPSNDGTGDGAFHLNPAPTTYDPLRPNSRFNAGTAILNANAGQPTHFSHATYSLSQVRTFAQNFIFSGRDNADTADRCSALYYRPTDDGYGRTLNYRVRGNQFWTYHGDRDPVAYRDPADYGLPQVTMLIGFHGGHEPYTPQLDSDAIDDSTEVRAPLPTTSAPYGAPWIIDAPQFDADGKFWIRWPKATPIVDDRDVHLVGYRYEVIDISQQPSKIVLSRNASSNSTSAFVDVPAGIYRIEVAPQYGCTGFLCIEVRQDEYIHPTPTIVN